MRCPLCREQSADWPAPNSFTSEVTCQNCGSFRITDKAAYDLNEPGNEAMAFDLGCWVYTQNRLGSTPIIKTDALTFIKNYPRPATKTRAELYLGRAIYIVGKKLRGRIHISDPKLRVASWSFHTDDAIALAEYLLELGALEKVDSPVEYRLVAKAHILYEEMAETRAASSQVFVAIWFDAEMKEAYDCGFAAAIVGAGYDPLRIDRKEHDRKIDDEIIAEIRRSAFVVADFTEHRGGVYYEAGFAHGLGRRVIFTCQREHIDKLHFDVRQYNTIIWDDPADIVAPLQNRILALFGAGPLNPDARPIFV
jgi:hypothetical protein